MKNPLISFARAFYSTGTSSTSPPSSSSVYDHPTSLSTDPSSSSSEDVNSFFPSHHPSHSPDSLIHASTPPALNYAPLLLHQYMDPSCSHQQQHLASYSLQQLTPNHNLDPPSSLLKLKLRKLARPSSSFKSKHTHHRFDFSSVLPTEICLHVMSYLPAASILEISACSRAFYTLTNDPGVWRSLYRSDPKLWASRLSRPGPLSRSSLNLVACPVRTILPSPPASPTKRLQINGINEDIDGDIIMYDDDASSRFVDWKNLYKNRVHLESNWGVHAPKVSVLRGHADSVYCIQFDANIIVSGSRDQTIKIWSLATGETLRTLTGHTGSVLCLQYNDRILVTGSSDASVMIWDMRTGLCTGTLRGHGAGVLDVAVENEYIVSCSKDACIKVWVKQDQYVLKHTLQGHRAAVNAIQLHGDTLVSASGDYMLKVWNVRSGTLVRTLEGHTRGIACVAFDGHLIVSGSNDQTIRVWELATGACVHIFQGHKDLVRTLALDSARGLVISGSYDQSVKVWQLPAHVMQLVHKYQHEHRVCNARVFKRARLLPPDSGLPAVVPALPAVVAPVVPDLISHGGPVHSFDSTHSSWVFNVAVSSTHIVSASQDQTIVVYDYTAGIDKNWVI